MSAVVDLTLDLCHIASITGDEAAVADHLTTLLMQMGLRVHHQEVEHEGKRAVGRHNILALVDDKPPQILLSTHIDTVPPFIAPKLVMQDGVQFITGRGVIDAKGIVAAQMMALKELLATGETRVGLLFVVGEETNSDGAKAAVACGFAPQVRYLLNGEPTDGKLVVAMKGVMAFELAATGVAAHSAYPLAGHSALHQLLDDLARLRAEPWPVDDVVGATTLNVGLLHGGVAPNVLAPQADAVCVMRTSTDADVLLARVQALVDPRTTIAVRTKSGPQHLVTVPGEDTCVVAFGCDVPHLRPLTTSNGGPLLVGPGSILDAHTAHERVRTADLDVSVAQYVRLTQQLLQQ